MTIYSDRNFENLKDYKDNEQADLTNPACPAKEKQEEN